MLTWEKFQNVFMNGKKPYWWLYLGKTRANGTQIGSNTEEGDIEQSWQLLQELVENYGDNVFTVEVRSSVNANRNNPQHTFAFGDVQAAEKKVAGTAPAQPDYVGAFTKGVDMRYWMDKVDTLNDRLRAVELENVSLKNALQLERMKRKEDAAKPEDNTARILGIVERNPGLVENLVSAFTGGGGRPAAVGVLKTSAPIPPPPPPPILDLDGDHDDEDWDDDDDSGSIPAGHFSIDGAVSACYRLMQALPGHNINELLIKLADTAEREPAKIEMAIKLL